MAQTVADKSASQRKLRGQRRESGLCVTCGDPATRGSMCEAHAAAADAAAARYRARRAEREAAPRLAAAPRAPAGAAPAAEFEVTLKVRNNLLKARRLALGLGQVALSRLAGVHAQHYGPLECLRASPLRGDGRWRDCAVALATFYCVEPEELWPDAVLRVRSPEVTREVSGEALLSLAGVSGSPPALPDEALDGREMAAAVRGLLGTLKNPREAEVLRRRFGVDREECTLDEVAVLWNVTGERVRQVEKRALKRLRRRSAAVAPWRLP